MMPSPDPGGPAAEQGSELAQLRDLADDVITVGGDGSAKAGRAGHDRADGPQVLLDIEQRARMATESEPNGWFAGPHADPDRFELLGPGLAGGEGNTWRGRYRGELTAPLTLAVKELRRPPHAPPEWPTPADLRRWNDQRALLQYMRIDHLVTVIDIFVGAAPHLPGAARGVTPDTPYVVMEWVPGPTLADQLSGIPASASDLDERLAHVQHVAEALHALHSRTASAGNPTLHRDVKPTNCILDPRRGVVLVDVGTMRRVDDGYDHDGFHTPAYTAPEVLANPREARAASSDLYSLGALAYFCVVGEDPPVSDQPEAAEQIHRRLLAAARAAEVADEVGFVGHLQLMLDPSPHRRTSDAMSWSRRLRSLAAPRRPRALLRTRQGRIGAGLVAVAVAMGAVLVVQQQSDDPATASPSGASSSAALPSGVLPPASRPQGGPGAPPSGNLSFGAPEGRDGTIRTRFAAITFPANGKPAVRCTTVRGTSKLPAGQTLITSVENLEMQDGVRHLQLVQGWEQPSSLRRWQGLQFIGLPQDALGGRFRVEVIMVPLASLKQQIAAGGGERGAWRSQFPPGSLVVASLRVTRAAGEDPATCGPPGPPGPA